MKTNTSYISDSVVIKTDEDHLNAVTAPSIRIHHAGTTAEETHIIKEKKRYGYLFIKRTFDIVASFFGLVLLSPLFLAISVAILIDSRGKIVYSQRRIGKNGKVFRIYKFRSMVKNADEVLMRFTPEQRAEFEVNFKLENDPRITKVGAFLRNTSLDELPQLINIFLGHISVIGPRPIVEYETYKYSDKIDKLLSIKPGLTGYWQVNGRSDTTYEERVDMEIYYIDNCSILFDIKIFLATFAVVLKRKGAC